MNSSARRRRSLLRLPTLSACAASNHQVIQERLSLVVDRISRSTSSDAVCGAELSDIERELDELDYMLELQRTKLVGATDEQHAKVQDQPCRTYLQLYEAEVGKGNYAAARPWFDRYSECKQTRPEKRQLTPRRPKWQGPR